MDFKGDKEMTNIPIYRAKKQNSDKYAEGYYFHQEWTGDYPNEDAEEREEKIQICGFIDKNGKEIIPLKYSNASSYSDGLAAVCKDNKCGYIDKSGKEVIKIKYDSVTDFNEGVAIVESNGKKMYIDKSGKKVISKEFEDAGNFTGEYAVAKKDGKVGVIDKKGNWIIEPDFEEKSLDEDMVIFKVSESYFMLPFEEIKK